MNLSPEETQQQTQLPYPCSALSVRPSRDLDSMGPVYSAQYSAITLGPALFSLAVINTMTQAN